MQYIATKPTIVQANDSYVDAVTYVNLGQEGDWKFTYSFDLESKQFCRVDEFSAPDDYFEESSQAVPAEVEAAFDLVRPVMETMIHDWLKKNPPGDDRLPFSVFGYFESSGKLFVDHVFARSAMHAFAVSAMNVYEIKNFIAALPGHLSEHENGLVFPGESVVDSDTVVDQIDVFK